MLRPRTPFLVSASLGFLGLTLAAACKAIFDVTVQDFWKDTATPYLREHVGAWSATMLEWVGPYWLGFASAFLLMLVVEVIFAGRRKNGAPPKKNENKGEAAPLSVVANQAFSRCQILLDGIRYINCSFDKVFVTWDGGPYMLENCQIDATRVDGFQTNNPAIAEQMRLYGLLGLLHPKGARGMGLPIEPADEILFRPAGTGPESPIPNFAYEIRSVENHWVLAVTNNGDEATFSAKLDLDGLSSHWLRKPAETLDGTWGLNQNASNNRRIARGAREAMYLLEVSRVNQACQSFVWGLLNNKFWGVSTEAWEASCDEADAPHGVIRVSMRVSTQPDKIFTIMLSITGDRLAVISSADLESQSPQAPAA